MKKIIAAIIVLVGLVSVFDLWDKHGQKIKDLSSSGMQKVGEQIFDLTEKKEVSTPGALRFSTEGKNSYLTRAGTINQTNLERQKQGLPALVENQKLNQAALAKVKDMFQGQYFEHISPTGKGPSNLADEASYAYIAVGENLALGNFKDDAELVTAWMNSPGHRANILNKKYMEIGVAVMQGEFEGHKTWLAVQEFGKPANSCPVVDAGLKSQLKSYQAEAQNLKIQIDELKSYLDSHNPKTKEETDEYNAKVNQFNDLVKTYNNKIDWIKQMTEIYNQQVRSFNECVGG